MLENPASRDGGGLGAHGLDNLSEIFSNLPIPAWVEQGLLRRATASPKMTRPGRRRRSESRCPSRIPAHPDSLLNPRSWRDGAAFDVQAAKLATMFEDNVKAYAGEVSEAVRQAGPRTV